MKAALTIKYKIKYKKYLSLYYEWLEKGETPTFGLCAYFDSNHMGLDFDFPKEFWLIYNSVPFEERGYYWAQDDIDDCWNANKFTPLRQNIILLMACLNNEI